MAGTQRRTKVLPELTEMDRTLMSVADSECYKCEHLHECRAIVKLGLPVLCQPAGVALIPVIGYEVTSEFDGISITASVWREHR